MAHILLVEDDLLLQKAVQRILPQHSFETVSTLELGREALLADCFDLLILDIRLPDGNGLELLGSLRTLVLTGETFADYGEQAFLRGASDYLVKPFLPTELRCRVEQVLHSFRKGAGLRVAEREPLAWFQGTTIPLTPLQHRLLQALVVAHGEVCTRSWLLEMVWQRADCFPGCVDTAIEVLRKRLIAYTGRSWVRTAYGRGYYILPED